MSLNETQQIFELWKRADSILIAFEHDPRFDGEASALALALILQKLGKNVEIACDKWIVPNELKFLPKINIIKPTIEYLQKFMIEVDVAKTPVKELSYDVKDGKLQISLVPKSGIWQTQDVSSKSCDYRFDLICTIGAPDLESLGQMFHRHTDFFYHTPILNIDHDPANEHYGQLNLIDINATSIAEVLFDLVTKIDRHLIDEDAATCMLTGMVGKTKSFKEPTVTPKTLAAAGELVAIGARREEIINNLYRTRTVPTLRLWGRALARLKHDKNSKLVWTVLTADDFVHAGADAKNLDGVIDELIINAPEANAALIIYEDNSEANKKIICVLHAERPFSAIELCKPFGATGSRDIAMFEIRDKTLLEAESLITESLKQRMKI